jgi:hypothetical protein
MYVVPAGICSIAVDNDCSQLHAPLDTQRPAVDCQQKPASPTHMCAAVIRRYRKKVEKDEDYIRTVVQLGASIETLVKQVSWTALRVHPMRCDQVMLTCRNCCNMRMSTKCCMQPAAQVFMQTGPTANIVCLQGDD